MFMCKAGAGCVRPKCIWFKYTLPRIPCLEKSSLDESVHVAGVCAPQFALGIISPSQFDSAVQCMRKLGISYTCCLLRHEFP